jgi:lipoprotein NlpI
MHCFYFPLTLALMAITMSTARSDEADEAIKKASQALDAHDYEAVLKAAEDAVKADPEKAMGWFLRGEAKSHFRKHEEAIKDYDEAYKLDKTLIAAINQRGGARFCLGMVKESIEDFEKFIEAKPKAYDSHWRYGIALYYAGRPADGAKQFKAGEIAFGDDVENVFWHYLCNAKVDGLDKARKAVLSVKPDRRVPMMKVYDLIRGKIKPDEVIETSEKAKLEGEGMQEALFYAHLYVGLNYEAEGNAKKCLEHLTTAVEKHKITHYMWDVGNVHLKQLKKK